MADKKSKGQEGGFGRFLWNPDTSEFLGRTAASWFKITVFYILFFAGLAAFFGLMLWIFYQTLDPMKPKWILDQGLIGTNPGVGFRPMPDQDSNVESTLIWYKRGSGGDWKYWSDQLNNFMKEYKDPESGKSSTGSSSGESCTWKNPVDAKRFCKIELSKMDECSEATNFGYEKGEPCVLIKLNRIYGWKPIPFTSADREPFPSDMPQELKSEINATSAEETYVWFSCKGENPADVENLGTDIRYYPKQGIPTYYFPYEFQKDYLSPFIFVHFNPLKGVLINIECTAWARNIEPSRQERVGKVHFELMID